VTARLGAVAATEEVAMGRRTRKKKKNVKEENEPVFCIMGGSGG
jgi:hypothetical protein